ncbi:MAG: S24/S26 family peptidase [Candidatus Omnitrophica bacterium]|nr:S24/S26 family peptidase [Candidatus Omnitrophota bacterium]MBU1928460.1 S24/S26 family peptidase [Candidatus Omnitrophota bacterium]
MWPFLKSGQKVIVRKTPLKDLKTGDLLLYNSGNQIVCHRLIRKDKPGENYLLYTRGDLSLSAPEKITEEMLLGRVCGIIKNDKLINCGAENQQFLYRAIVIIAPLIAWLIERGQRLFN